ncbi:hypothetical protein BV20DRAFT_1013789, partial [Pilatotrama ljubarskyi]
MHAKILATILLSVVAVGAVPVEGSAVPQSSTSSPATASAASDAQRYSSQASSMLKALNSELSAVDPSGTVYTAYITNIAGRPIVEMSAIGGEAFPVVTSSTDSESATPTFALPGSPLSAASSGGSAAHAASTSITMSLPTGGPELASALSSIASQELATVQAGISILSKTELTVFLTEASGTPVVAISSIGGPAITLAPTGASDAFETTFDGFHATAIPGSKNAATGLSVSRPLLTGIAGVLGAFSAGVVMLL